MENELVNDRILKKSKIHKHLRGGFKKLNFESLIVEDVDLATYTIDLGIDFWKHTRNLEEKVLEVLQKIKTKEETDWSLKSSKQDRMDFVIGNTMKYMYLNTKDSEYNFFYFVTDMLIALLKSHPAQNGNKRFAAAYLKFFLYQHGYHLDWLRNKKTEDVIVGFVVSSQNKKKSLTLNQKNNLRQTIYNWITQNTVVANNYRKDENIECFGKKSINQSLENIKKEPDWQEFIKSMIRLADI